MSGSWKFRGRFRTRISKAGVSRGCRRSWPGAGRGRSGSGPPTPWPDRTRPASHRAAAAGGLASGLRGSCAIGTRTGRPARDVPAIGGCRDPWSRGPRPRRGRCRSGRRGGTGAGAEPPSGSALSRHRWPGDRASRRRREGRRRVVVRAGRSRPTVATGDVADGAAARLGGQPDRPGPAVEVGGIRVDLAGGAAREVGERARFGRYGRFGRSAYRAAAAIRAASLLVGPSPPPGRFPAAPGRSRLRGSGSRLRSAGGAHGVGTGGFARAAGPRRTRHVSSAGRQVGRAPGRRAGRPRSARRRIDRAERLGGTGREAGAGPARGASPRRSASGAGPAIAGLASSRPSRWVIELRSTDRASSTYDRAGGAASSWCGNRDLRLHAAVQRPQPHRDAVPGRPAGRPPTGPLRGRARDRRRLAGAARRSGPSPSRSFASASFFSDMPSPRSAIRMVADRPSRRHPADDQDACCPAARTTWRSPAARPAGARRRRRRADQYTPRRRREADALVLLDLGDRREHDGDSGTGSGRRPARCRPPASTSRFSSLRRMRVARWSSRNSLASWSGSSSPRSIASSSLSCRSTSVWLRRARLTNIALTLRAQRGLLGGEPHRARGARR